VTFKGTESRSEGPKTGPKRGSERLSGRSESGAGNHAEAEAGELSTRNHRLQNFGRIPTNQKRQFTGEELQVKFLGDSEKNSLTY
jgi:hypothetical protein